MNRKIVLGGVAAVVLAAGVAVAALAPGSGSAGSSYGGTPAPATSSGAAAAATVTTAMSDLGQILVDGAGRTLYLFEADPAGTSTCNDACAGVWPPLTTAGAAQADGQVTAGQLGTLRRGDGTTQLTYHGHPLYTYAGDSRPGAANGQGLDQFGAEWYVLAPSGNKIDSD